MVVLRWISWLCSDGFLWLCSSEFRGCEIGLWAGGATVLWFVVGQWPLWIRGGHSVGLWRWGCGAGIMEVWLWVWDCGGGCAVDLLHTKEKKSPERKRRTNREMNNKKI